MLKHLIPAAFSRLNLNSRPVRFVLPALLAGLLSGCAPQPALQPGLDQGFQLAYGDKAPDQAPEPVAQAGSEPVLEAEKNKKAACNKPYKIKGKTYYPMKSAAGYTAQGLASWYGPESGNRTASGSRFNPKALSAAHKTLPIPSKVRVTNLRNGRFIDVLINDRGPFNGGKIIDLSQGAAEQIGMRGLTEVRVEYLGA